MVHCNNPPPLSFDLYMTNTTALGLERKGLIFTHLKMSVIIQKIYKHVIFTKVFDVPATIKKSLDEPLHDEVSFTILHLSMVYCYHDSVLKRFI